MFEVAVISGKGGTGKTTVSGALATLLPDLIKVDADVDAANFHLLFPALLSEEAPFFGGKMAKIDPGRCTGCGRCETVCRYKAVEKDSGSYRIHPHLCEGCNACVVACPSQAISLEEEETARTLVSQMPVGAPLISAKMKPGAEGSGKLVTQLRKLARGQKGEGVLIDSSPGVACTLMSALSGVDFAVIVTEPTLSGERDFARVLEVVNHFQIKCGFIVNKFDLNPTLSDRMIEKARESSVRFLGKLPFDPQVSKAINQRESMITYAPQAPVSLVMKEIAGMITAMMAEEKSVGPHVFFQP